MARAAAAGRAATRSRPSRRPVGRPSPSRSMPGRSTSPSMPVSVGRHRVQHPGAARTVLDAHRSLGDEGVEPPAVERAGDRLVVADRPQPLALAQRGVRRASAAANWSASATYGGPHERRALGRGQGEEVDVVVVQAGDERAAAGRRARRRRGARRAGGRSRRSPRRSPARRRASRRRRRRAAPGQAWNSTLSGQARHPPGTQRTARRRVATPGRRPSLPAARDGPRSDRGATRATARRTGRRGARPGR